MNNPTVSVIIPVYNGALLVCRCLDSVFSQNGNFDVEVIVIDDGSTDNSIDIINQYTQKILLIQQSNQGPAAARNKGIEAATGKYLAFLDADDYWKPDFLKETISFLDANSELVAVTVGQVHNTVSSKDNVHPKLLTFNQTKYSEPFIIDDFFKLWKDQQLVCTGSVLMKTSLAKKIGGQREDLRITEDIEFWACIAVLGKWGFIPKILFVSDGNMITKNIGWIEKNRKRWESAQPIEIWEERILDFAKDQIPNSYYGYRGKIMKNIIYSMIMSKRINASYNLISKNRKQLPNDNLSKLYVLFSFNKLFWNIMAYFLIKREYMRKI